MTTSDLEANSLDTHLSHGLPIFLVFASFCASGGGAVGVLKISGVASCCWVRNGEVESHVREARVPPKVQVDSGLF